MGAQKRGVSGLISHIAWVNVSPKPCQAKLYVNFLHKLYQKYVKQDVLKHWHHPPHLHFFLNKYKMYPKKWCLKFLVYFCCFFSTQVSEKGSLSLKKLVIMWKYMILILKWHCLYFYLKPFRSRGILVKSLKTRIMACPVGPNCRNTAYPRG